MDFLKVFKQIKIWTWSAKVLPATALAFVIAERCFGLETLIDQTIVATITVFFGTAVYWWWWTMQNIKDAMTHMSKAAQEFAELTRNLRDINNDLGDRKRPK
jgi:arginine exporter protein ArgO